MPGWKAPPPRSDGQNAVVRYEVLDHTADTGLRAYGVTLYELFENAAWGMFDLMFSLDEFSPIRDVPVVATGDTHEELLFNWLSELLYHSEALDLAFCYFTVDRLEEGGVQGSAGGVPIATAELRGPPIKAVTYHDLVVVQNPGTWWARVIFDV
jgi:SHS2 domain-containing protein